jgi:16S rRNA (cytosine1402-N4)-methyltransferase
VEYGVQGLHIPVLAEEALAWLSPALAGMGPLVDCTLGTGGHAEVFLRELPDLVVVGIDRDEQALEIAERRLKGFGRRVRLARGNFADLAWIVKAEGYDQVGATLYDLGVSSLQLDRADRGFGYRQGFSLDMRMEPGAPLSAAEIVSSYSESRLGDVIHRFGEERYARRIARAIVARRARRPFSDAGDLADVIKEAIPAATRRTGPHPARRTFQALRIETNAEIEALERSLPLAFGLLRPGGRVGVISYHSLEDRLIKHAFRSYAQGCVCPPDLPVCVCGRQPELKVLTRKPVRPGEEEVARNRRADSARLRVAEKLAEAA